MKTLFRKRTPRQFHDRGGFSLIEIIATLVLSALLVTLILPLIGSGVTGSTRPLLRMPETYNLRTVMDDWWYQYREFYGQDLPALSIAINEDAETAPYQVLYNNWVEFDANGLEVETPGDTNNTLRVTLGNAQGEMLTAYFSPIP